MALSELAPVTEISRSSAISRGAPEPNLTPQTPQLTEATASNTPSPMPNGQTDNLDMSNIPPTNVSSCKEISADLQAGKYEFPVNRNTPAPTAPTAPDAQLLHLYPTMTPYQQMRYRSEFNFVPMLPSPVSDAKIVMIQNIRQMALLGATIEDDQRRANFWDRVFDSYKQIWYEALRLGYDPGQVSEEEHKPRARTMKTPRKKVHPAAESVFTSEKFKDLRGKFYNLPPITAGEFMEAHITTEEVNSVMGQKASEIDGFLQRVHDFLGREVEISDWNRVQAATFLNPGGRDLFFFAIYTAQLYVASLKQLHKFQSSFRTVIQAKNGQKRIANDQASLNFLLATALEINKRKSYLRDAKQPGEKVVALGKETGSHEVASPAPSSRVNLDYYEPTPVNRAGNVVTDTLNQPDASTASLPNKRSAQDEDISLASPSKRQKGTVTTSASPMEHERAHAQQDSSSLEARVGSQDASDQPSPTPTLMMEPLDAKQSYVKQFLTPLANELLAARNLPPLNPLTQYLDIKKTLVNAGIPVLERNKVVELYNTGAMHKWQDPALVRKMREELAAHPNAVTLAVNANFDAERLSHYSVHYCKGFRFRFTEESTIAERIAADSSGLVNMYVQDRINHPEKYPRERHGSYEAVSLPMHPTKKDVLHGIWDDKDGNPLLQEYPWFYRPRDYPHIKGDYGVQLVPKQTDTGDDATAPKKEKQVRFAPLPNADLNLRDEANPTIHLRMPSHHQDQDMTDADSKLGTTPPKPTRTPTKGPSKYSKRRQAPRPRMMGVFKRPNSAQRELTLSGRPQRTAAATHKEYVESPDAKTEAGDDEWTPSDDGDDD
ncbi:hypothetical protein B0A52_02621 [Exophiala mesophila]|uniref:Uncharacterized protein n=1 Tax=Exophiala mesophila TaxID=212818 RepID=A0A438NDF1_EXOME|nr:hypothetical protein B0A52_02621 [Exophiala mesophila]